VTAQIQIRRDTSTNWTTNNPVLKAGEMGLDTTTMSIKVGDGTTAWSSLNYVAARDYSSYTPTLAQGVTNNIAKTVNYAKYIQTGKLVEGNVRVTATAAGTAGSNITLSLPVTAATSGLVIGSGSYFDTGSAEYRGGILSFTTTTISLLPADVTQATVNASLGTTPSIAVASGDVFNVSFQYEAA
jgi:hypothetical protein